MTMIFISRLEWFPIPLLFRMVQSTCLHGPQSCWPCPHQLLPAEPLGPASPRANPTDCRCCHPVHRLADTKEVKKHEENMEKIWKKNNAKQSPWQEMEVYMPSKWYWGTETKGQQNSTKSTPFMNCQDVRLPLCMPSQDLPSSSSSACQPRNKQLPADWILVQLLTVGISGP